MKCSGAGVTFRANDGNDFAAARVKRIEDPNLDCRTPGSMTLLRPVPARPISLSALGLAACQKGLSVGFTTAAALVHELIEARDEKRLFRLQQQLAAYKLLIIDELGYVPLSTTGAELCKRRRENPSLKRPGGAMPWPLNRL